MVFYLIHKHDCVNEVLSCYYAKFYTFIFDGTPILLTNKIISTISTFRLFRSFRLSKIISTLSKFYQKVEINFDHFDHPKKSKLFHFDFMYNRYKNYVT
jgi:hypothetical protein